MKKILFILGVFGMHSPAFAEESYLCSPFSFSNQPTLVDIDTTQPDKITIKATSNQTGADFDIVTDGATHLHEIMRKLALVDFHPGISEHTTHDPFSAAARAPYNFNSIIT